MKRPRGRRPRSRLSLKTGWLLPYKFVEGGVGESGVERMWFSPEVGRDVVFEGFLTGVCVLVRVGSILICKRFELLEALVLFWRIQALTFRIF